MPVMGYKIESFNIGRRRFRSLFTEVGGVAAALEIGEKDVAMHRKAGRHVAYVSFDLCVVTTDLSMVRTHLSKKFDGDELEKAMVFYGSKVGYPLLHGVHADEFDHERGKPYDLYAGCDEEGDFDKVDSHMEREYARILKANASFAKNPAEVDTLYAERANGSTTEQAILHFAVAAHEHDKQSTAFRADAIHRCNVWKAKHGLSKVDLNDPRIRAFTAPVWERHIDHREYAKSARALLKKATEAYTLQVADERDYLPF
ncbi:hypothetical protein [Paraburkholderia aspalathi]|uniref:hypothetical protein n=1 Tax=Paraburkholderia aspalathi TaxID=1324617 RepID=UPI001BA62C0F|nr:hypothetical protein [Paraburkholderia aspalathi]